VHIGEKLNLVRYQLHRTIIKGENRNSIRHNHHRTIQIQTFLLLPGPVNSLKQGHPSNHSRSKGRDLSQVKSHLFI